MTTSTEIQLQEARGIDFLVNCAYELTIKRREYILNLLYYKDERKSDGIIYPNYKVRTKESSSFVGIGQALRHAIINFIHVNKKYQIENMIVSRAVKSIYKLEEDQSDNIFEIIEFYIPEDEQDYADQCMRLCNCETYDRKTCTWRNRDAK